jgi:hypothetical protein
MDKNKKKEVLVSILCNQRYSVEAEETKDSLCRLRLSLGVKSNGSELFPFSCRRLCIE